jgi:hypothetical protein
LKKSTVLGIFDVWKKQCQSQRSRPLNFAPIWGIPQEAKSDRAIFASTITSDNAIAVACVVRRLAIGAEL